MSSIWPKAMSAALRRLFDSPGSFTVNLGTGRGHSVLEVVRRLRRAPAAARCPTRCVPRRPGDVAAC